jgi:hypothetical protein
VRLTPKTSDSMSAQRVAASDGLSDKIDTHGFDLHSATRGDSALDEEAVALLRWASPAPPPPPGLGHGASIALTAPLRFDS